MAKWVPEFETKPSWWDDLVGFANRIEDDGLGSTIIGIVATWLVGGILLFAEGIANALRIAFEPVLLAVDSLGGALYGVVEAVAAVNGLLIDAIRETVFSLAGTSPLAPVLVSVASVGLIALEAMILYYVLLGVLDYIPGVSEWLRS